VGRRECCECPGRERREALSGARKVPRGYGARDMCGREWSERPEGRAGEVQVFYNGAIAACRTHGTSTVVRLLPLPFARESTTSCSRLASVRKGAKALASTLRGAAPCQDLCWGIPSDLAARTLQRRREPLQRCEHFTCILATEWRDLRRLPSVPSPLRRARLPFLARVCAPAALAFTPRRRMLCRCTHTGGRCPRSLAISAHPRPAQPLPRLSADPPEQRGRPVCSACYADGVHRRADEALTWSIFAQRLLSPVARRPPPLRSTAA
jgi:hypothetical protein